MGHRKFLDMNHPWRFDETSFNGGRADRCPPSLISSTEAFKQVEQFKNDFGKKDKQNNGDNEGPWKKKSIFFELLYWKHNKCRRRQKILQPIGWCHV